MTERLQERVERVTQLIKRFHRLATLHFENRAQQFGLTVPQYMALQAIVELGPDVPMMTISRAIMYSPSSLTGIANRLVSMGLIERARPSDNRRAVVVTATRSGQELVESFTDGHRKDLFALLDAMKPERADDFIVSLAEFLDGVERLSEFPASTGSATSSQAPAVNAEDV